MPVEYNNLEAVVGRVLRNLYGDLDSPEVLGNGLPNLTAQAVSKLPESSFFSSTMDAVRMVGVVVTAVFGFLFVLMIWRTKKYRQARHLKLETLISPPEPGQGPYEARWKEVCRHVESFKDAEWRFAVIEADKMLEEILTKAGFAGETLGDKLMLINQNQLESIDELWEAHKLRNRVAHDPNYQVRHQEARQAVAYYEKALRELGALG